MSALWADDAPVLAFTPTRYDDPVATALIEEIQATYVRRYGGADRTPVHPEEFAPPTGLFLVGRLDGVPMSCGGWRLVPGEAGLAEIKRMYVAEAYRRRGLARVVLAELEATARAAGVTRIRLETGHRQPEAMALYESSGYTRIDNYGIYREHPASTCFAKNL
jgi:GNAT superfamily N-acetyltransferase